MKHFCCESWAAFAVLFFTIALWYSCSAAAEDISNVSTSSMLTTEYEAPCLTPCQTTCRHNMDPWEHLFLAPYQVFPKQPHPDVNFCTQAAMCCPTGMDDYGWIAAAVGWSLWFLTLILLCVDKVMKLRPDEPKYLVA